MEPIHPEIPTSLKGFLVALFILALVALAAAPEGMILAWAEDLYGWMRWTKP